MIIYDNVEVSCACPSHFDAVVPRGPVICIQFCRDFSTIFKRAIIIKKTDEQQKLNYVCPPRARKGARLRLQVRQPSMGTIAVAGVGRRRHNSKCRPQANGRLSGLPGSQKKRRQLKNRLQVPDLHHFSNHLKAKFHQTSLFLKHQVIDQAFGESIHQISTNLCGQSFQTTN